MMKIVLLEHPRVRSERHFNDIANTPLWSCLMTGYAAASLLEAGHDVQILDATRTSFEDAVQLAMAASPDILACHAVYFWENTGMLFDMLTELRRKGYGGIICLFGFFPTLAWEDLLRHVKPIDCVAVGEPEPILVSLAESAERTRVVQPMPGLAARFGEKPTLPGCRSPIESLDELPFPLRPLMETNETISILASRGCYNGCSFCLVPTLDGGKACWRFRSPENVIAEINNLTKQGKSDFYFVDPNFIGPGPQGGERTAKLAELLSGHGINFGMETRANDVTQPVLRALRKAGLTSLLLGIEAGNSRILQRLGKRTSVAENEKAIAVVRDEGIEPEIGFIMFDPAGTIDDIRENFDFLSRNRLLEGLGRTANLLCHEHIMFKGTPGYRLAAERGRLIPEGPFGFQGKPAYEDWRTGWLAEVVKPVCHHILTRTEVRESRIYWRAEESGNEAFRIVNDKLVKLFSEMLEMATHLKHQPEVSWTFAQIVRALDAVGALT